MKGIGQTVVPRIVTILLILQLVASVPVWTFSTVGVRSENLFALFTATNLVSFAMVSYLYQSHKNAKSANRGAMLVGLAMLFLLLFSDLFV